MEGSDVTADATDRVEPNPARSAAVVSSADLLFRGGAKALRWKATVALAATGATTTAIAGAHGWHFAGLWEHFTAFSGGAIALACGAVTIQWLSQAGRLWVVSSTATHARWPRTLQAFAVGQVVNLYLPARMGDAVKAGMLGQATGDRPANLGRAAGAVFIADKVLDIATIALIVAVTTARAPMHILSLPTLHFRTLIFAVTLVTAIAAGLHAWRPTWVARLRSLAASVIQGTAALWNPRRAIVGLALSVAAWSAEGAAFYVLTHAGGHALSFEQCLWVLALLNIGIAVPLSFANVGTFEASVVLATTSMGIPAMDALALAAVHHAVQLFVTCALALLLWMSLRGSRQRAMAQSEERAAHALPTRVARARG